MTAAPLQSELDRIFRAEHGLIVASLTRRFGDLDIAEEAVQEAMITAIRTWSESGLPPNPGAWLMTTARHKGLDRLRRESLRDRKQVLAGPVRPEHDDPVDPTETDVIGDDRLRLIFICCHPSLAEPARVALTLRLLGGLTVAEIAHAFLVPETTMAQRITRAKAKIKANRIAYRVPEPDELTERLPGVHAVLYLIFNESYLPSAGAEVRVDLAHEAIRLTTVLATLLPQSWETKGLAALMLLSEARRPARFLDDALVPLARQDRDRWDRVMIGMGHALVRDCLRARRPGPYQLLAAINAVHTDAATADRTDWPQVVALYDQLMLLAPSPIVALNRAVAVAEIDGPLAGLELVDALDADLLDGYHAYHVTRADLLRRLGRSRPARAAYDRAIELAGNTAETVYLQRMRATLP